MLYDKLTSNSDPSMCIYLSIVSNIPTHRSLNVLNDDSNCRRCKNTLHNKLQALIRPSSISSLLPSSSISLLNIGKNT